MNEEQSLHVMIAAEIAKAAPPEEEYDRLNIGEGVTVNDAAHIYRCTGHAGHTQQVHWHVSIFMIEEDGRGTQFQIALARNWPEAIYLARMISIGRAVTRGDLSEAETLVSDFELTGIMSIDDTIGALISQAMRAFGSNDD